MRIVVGPLGVMPAVVGPSGAMLPVVGPSGVMLAVVGPLVVMPAVVGSLGVMPEDGLCPSDSCSGGCTMQRMFTPFFPSLLAYLQLSQHVFFSLVVCHHRP